MIIMQVVTLVEGSYWYDHIDMTDIGHSKRNDNNNNNNNNNNMQ